eukprot:2477125-Alexandrium_andersonii.AAC.1
MGPVPPEEQGGRYCTLPQVFFKGAGWGQAGLILAEMRRRQTDPAEGGRTLANPNFQTGEPDV